MLFLSLPEFLWNSGRERKKTKVVFMGFNLTTLAFYCFGLERSLINVKFFKNKNIHFPIGERGIRTLGMGLPYDALAMRYLQPLGHLSNFG